MIDNENRKAINRLPGPIFKIQAEQSLNYDEMAQRDSGYLQKTLYLCVGARVVLNQNSVTEKGLFNAAKGTVMHILFNNDSEAQYVIVELDQCKIPVIECYN